MGGTSRPHIEKGSILANSLLEEISRLTSLNHPNIVNLYAKGQIELHFSFGKRNWPWFIMSYIQSAIDLQQLCEKQPPELIKLIYYLYDISKGIKYIHDNNVIHCDIKPANIFITSEPDKTKIDQAILADFGYSKNISDRNGETTVGFTQYFAHPDLVHGSKSASQSSRTFKKLNRDRVRPAFDLFAFGMTIHYLIETFYKKHSIYRKYNYEIKYLQLCSARLLDGLNYQKAITYARLPNYCFSDIGEFGKRGYLPGIKYTTADEILEDFEKLLGKSNPQTTIPELIQSRPENIQVSDMAPVIYTDRLRKIVDHPFFRRLASSTQLGVANLIYPGASHTRFEHSLGTFGVTSRYLMALYNDNQDPLFKQLANNKIIKATLLAALFHDIGQYPLAHDLEDISFNFFSHIYFGSILLTMKKEKDYQLQLLPDTVDIADKFLKDLIDILKNDWDLELIDIIKILEARNSDDKKIPQIGSHIDRLCKSLIDGPIDCDKVDYLQRDSRHCNVQYGFGIDIGRLFRCLTVTYNNIQDGHLLLVVGVQDKGRISAESLLFARYAMLTQVYWHHTMRTLKSFIHTATAEMLCSWDERQSLQKRNEFIHCAIFEEYTRDEEWLKTIKNSKAISCINKGDIRVLGWIWSNTTNIGKEAIEHLLNRNLFKTIMIIYRDDLSEKQRIKVERVFRPENFQDRCSLRNSIEKALLSALHGRSCSRDLLETQGYSESDWIKKINRKETLRCLIDYPAIRAGSSFGLQVVSKWGEKPGIIHEKTLEPKVKYPMIISSDNFKNGMRELEKSMSCLRIYWIPDEFNIFIEVIGEDQIIDIIIGEINNYKFE